MCIAAVAVFSNLTNVVPCPAAAKQAALNQTHECTKLLEVAHSQLVLTEAEVTSRDVVITSLREAVHITSADAKSCRQALADAKDAHVVELANAKAAVCDQLCFTITA